MPVDCNRRTLALGALMLSALALGGCSSSIAELGGTSTASSGPNQPAGYFPVEDLPPNRDQAAPPLDEQTKIKKELLAARDRQSSAVKDPSAAKDSAAKDKGKGKNQSHNQNQ